MRQCKFEGLASITQLMEKDWWMCTFNLAQGYHHMAIKEETRGLLGF